MWWWILPVLALLGVISIGILLGLVVGNIIRLVQGRQAYWPGPVSLRSWHHHHHHWWHHHWHHRHWKKPRKLTLYVVKS